MKGLNKISKTRCYHFLLFLTSWLKTHDNSWPCVATRDDSSRRDFWCHDDIFWFHDEVFKNHDEVFWRHDKVFWRFFAHLAWCFKNNVRFFCIRSLSKVIPERAKATAFINLSVTNNGLFRAPQLVNYSGLQPLLSLRSTILGNENEIVIMITCRFAVCHLGLL